MARRIGTKRRSQLIQSIFKAEHDVVALAAEHGLSPDELAHWANDQQNQRCLVGLCVLADLQTQLMLSRYRLLAAGRLIRLATQEEAEASADVARKACVDLLKLDLKRAGTAVAGEAEEADDDGEFESLRDMLYGDEAQGCT